MIVNDGSTDDTAIIIDALAEQNVRVKAFHQHNQGVSVARNTGIANSTGVYLTFIDADDEIRPGYLNGLMSAALNSGSDLVIGGYSRIPGSPQILKNGHFHRDEFSEIIMLKDIGVSVAKILKASLLKKFEISFPKGMKLSEDACFFYSYLARCQTCTLCDNTDYLYMIPTGDTKYNLTLEDELVGLHCMTDAICMLQHNVTLTPEAQTRLSDRLKLSYNRVENAILCTTDLTHRPQIYAKLNWASLLSVIKFDTISSFCIKHKFFFMFEITRILRSRLNR